MGEKACGAGTQGPAVWVCLESSIRWPVGLPRGSAK